jgi:hypothetical protein
MASNEGANDEPPGSSSMDLSGEGRPTTRPKENPPASTTPSIITSTPSPSPLPKFSYSPVPTTSAEVTPEPTSTAQPAVDFMDDSE